jgi:glycosyltransferase involved in cell wall biosynthesis
MSGKCNGVRVAWVVYGSLAQATGGYIYDRLIVEGLRDAGDSVDVVSIDPDLPARDLGARLVDLLPEVVVGDALCVSALAHAFAHVGGAARRVLLVHHLKSWETEVRDVKAQRPIEAAAIRQSDLVVATSDATSRLLVSEYPGARVVVVVPGADRLARLSREERAPDKVTLLYVGSVIPRKRLLLLAEALDYVGDPRIVTRFVGDTARDPAYERQFDARIARSSYLLSHTTRLGLVDDAVVAREFARADALVLPSSLEGYGMVLTEAIRSGLPLIVARCVAIPDVVRDGGAALVFEQPEDLCGAIARFAGDPELRTRMQRAADALSTTVPSWRGAAVSFREAIGGRRAVDRPSPPH